MRKRYENILEVMKKVYGKDILTDEFVHAMYANCYDGNKIYNQLFDCDPLCDNQLDRPFIAYTLLNWLCPQIGKSCCEFNLKPENITDLIASMYCMEDLLNGTTDDDILYTDTIYTKDGNGKHRLVSWVDLLIQTIRRLTILSQYTLDLEALYELLYYLLRYEMPDMAYRKLFRQPDILIESLYILSDCDISTYDLKVILDCTFEAI